MPKKISVNEPIFDDSEVNIAQTILDSGLLSSSNMYGGKYVKTFEKQLSKLLDCKYAVAVNSGTSALYASLLSLGIKSGDEVIVPSFSFTATASAVIATGATPVFVDISSSNYNIDISLIKSHISKNTKAIIPVHLYGHPVDIEQLSEITSSNNIPIIEDGAQSLGSSIDGKKCGTLGDLGCTSLYPTKIITSGEGGVITTNDDELYNQLLMIRNHGLDKSGQTIRFGLNLRMPELEAALASIQLSKLDDFVNFSYNKIFRNFSRNSFFYDAKISFSGLNKVFSDEINKLYPFGSGNPEPVFLFENLKISKVKVLDKKHITNLFTSKNGFSIQAISFNSINESIGKYLLNYKKEINVIGYLNNNFWNNKKILQLVVRDIII